MQVVDSEGYLKVKLIGGPVGPFVPYTGATGDVDLGEFELKAGQIELDQTPTGTAGVAVMRWNDTDGTADLGLKGGNVTLQIGQEQVTRVVNKTGTNLLEANYSAVRISGAQGNRIKVDLAQADNDANSADTLGLVTETINDNQEGFVTASGLVRNINTTGSLQTETWLDGDVLYLSGTVAGRITNIKPTAPIHTVIMGYVIRAHATQGQIYVKVDNGYELDELHNVAITTPLNNQVLQYETATSLWKNKTISTGITIGTTAITSGTVGSVLFEGTGNVVSESANLFWDNTNGRLGIGTSSPLFALDVNGTARVVTSLDVNTGSGILANGANNPVVINSNYWSNGDGFVIASKNTTDSSPKLTLRANSAGSCSLQLYNNGNKSYIRQINTSGVGGQSVYLFQLDNRQAKLAVTADDSTTDASFFGKAIWDGGAAATFRASSATQTANIINVQNHDGTSTFLNVKPTGNVLINTTTDAGYKLDVNGTARISGAVTTTTTITAGGNIQGTNLISTANMWCQNILYGTNFFVSLNGSAIFGGTSSNASAILQADSTTKGFLPPRMTTTQRNAIASPAAGLVVYDNTDNKHYGYNGTTWNAFY